MDILDVKKGYILHQVNCRGVMGGGVAKAIRSKFPKCFPPYNTLCKGLPWLKRFLLLGHAQIIDVEQDLHVVNLFGQLDTSANERQTEYGALSGALTQFVLLREPGKPIYIPYMIGCGLGGGDWTIVSHMLSHIFADIDDVFICKKPDNAS